MRTDPLQTYTEADRQSCWVPFHAALLLAASFSPTVGLSAETLALTISGVAGEVRENVEAALRIHQRRNDPALTSDAISSLHAAAAAEIRLALEPYGYYRPEIETELAEPAAEGETWRATYRISTGEPVRITSLDTTLHGNGAEDSALIALVESFPLSEGQPFRHLDYEKAKSELLNQAHSLGYLDARYDEPRVEVDVAAYTTSIRLALDTGLLHVVGPISFEQEITRHATFADEFLARHLVLQPGEPLSQSKLAEQRRLLSRSGYFEEVLIQQGDASSDDQSVVPLTIHVTPFKANRYRGQLGWGTDTGVGLRGDWNRRYFGSNGHRFIFGGSAVQDQSRLAGDLRYTIPFDPITSERLELVARIQSRTLGFEDLDLEEGGETRILNGRLSAFWHGPARSLGDFELRTRAGLSVVRESYDIFEILFGNLPEDRQKTIIGLIGEEAFDTLTPDFEAVVPSVRLTATRRDDDLYIRRGDYVNLEVLGANSSVGSNVDFWQVRLNTWNIRPIGNVGRLLLRTSAGYSDAETETALGASFNQMPEYYEFRAGGARSIRGYAYEELVPERALTGGKHLLLGSVEYEHEIIPDWSVAAFVDAGNAFNDFDSIEEKYGVGIGARWRSPVGVARVDFAFPLDDSEDSFQFYITVGPEF